MDRGELWGPGHARHLAVAPPDFRCGNSGGKFESAAHGGRSRGQSQRDAGARHVAVAAEQQQPARTAADPAGADGEDDVSETKTQPF